MQPLEKKIKKLLVEKNVIQAGESVVVGVSGGPDSLCLLYVLNNLAEECSFLLVAAYFDHGLRPTESTQEIDFVGEAAKSLGISFYHGFGDVRRYAKENGLSIEEAARTLRYEYLQEVLIQCGAQKIAVAHTADDQAEELLLRMIRGAGRKGLAGMAFVRDDLVIRPFLETPKAEILAYLADNKKIFCLDSSNQQRIYLRNRVRLDLIPYLEDGFNPGIKKVLRQTASLLQDEECLLEAMCQEAYQGVVSGDELLELDNTSFLLEHVAIQRRIVEKILLKLGNHPGFRQIDQIITMIRAGETCSSIHLSQGLRGRCDGSKTLFSYPKGKTPLRGGLAEVEEFPAFALYITEPGIYDLDSDRQVEIVCLDDLPNKSELASPLFDFFDLAKLSFPLTIRNRLPGDKFYPLGGSGHKKVGNFLTDHKSSRTLRQRVPVLLCGDVIVALLGVRISHLFRVDDFTRMVMRVRVFEK